MLDLVACLVLAQAPIEQPPRLRTVLENGAVVLVEPMPREPSVTISLWISSAAYPEEPAHNGIRHLLEHFLARGPKGDLDQRLESAGGFLRASTYRDAMNFEIMVPKSEIDLGFRLIREVMTLPEVTSESIQNEAKIMREEQAIREPATVLAAAAWDVAYGGKSPDPFGNIDIISAASPEQLRKAHKAMLRGDGTALVVTGDVDLDVATRKAREALSFLPKTEPIVSSRPIGKGGVTQAEGTGEARAALVEGIRSPSTAAALMAGLAIASEIEPSFFVYTPSAQPGVMLVGRSNAYSSLSEELAKLNPSMLRQQGRLLAERWVRAQLANGRGVAHLRGQLLSQGAALRPEILLENIRQVTDAQFADAFNRYLDDRSVKVVR